MRFVKHIAMPIIAYEPGTWTTYHWQDITRERLQWIYIVIDWYYIFIDTDWCKQLVGNRVQSTTSVMNILVKKNTETVRH